MITWSQKTEILDAHEHIIKAKNGFESLGFLVEYIEIISNIPEVNIVITKSLKTLTGFGSATTKEVYRLVKGGKNEDDQVLVNMVGGSDVFSQDIKLQKNSLIIASQLNFILGQVEVNSDKLRIVFDINSHHLHSSIDKKRFVDYSNGEKTTQQFEILKRLKIINSPASAEVLGKHIGADPKNIRRAVPDVNRKFELIFGQPIIDVVKGTSRKKLYKLNEHFDYQ